MPARMEAAAHALSNMDSLLSRTTPGGTQEALPHRSHSQDPWVFSSPDGTSSLFNPGDARLGLSEVGLRAPASGAPPPPHPTPPHLSLSIPDSLFALVGLTGGVSNGFQPAPPLGRGASTRAPPPGALSQRYSCAGMADPPVPVLGARSGRNPDRNPRDPHLQPFPQPNFPSCFWGDVPAKLGWLGE